MENGVTNRRGESMTFEGKEYDVGRLLDALEEGNGDGESLAGDDAAKGSRKTPHCLPRLVNTMVGDEFRPRMIESEAHRRMRTKPGESSREALSSETFPVLL